MKNPLKVAIPVGFCGYAVASLELSISDTCVSGMYLATLTNNTRGEIITTPKYLSVAPIKQGRGDEHSFGVVGDNTVVVEADINRFTRLVMAITVRDSCATALAKVYVRGALHLNAMYRGDGKNRIVVDKFTKVTKEMAAWRTPNSRLSLALKAISK